MSLLLLKVLFILVGMWGGGYLFPISLLMLLMMGVEGLGWPFPSSILTVLLMVGGGCLGHIRGFSYFPLYWWGS